MAINRVPYTTTPTPVSGDWALINNLMQTGYLKMQDALRIDYDNDNVLKGAVFQIGGTVYLADSDTAITGTPSSYVKITPSGATAAAAYVANLTGVTWNDTYNGYYDVSGNLYVFDEATAYISQVVTERNFSNARYIDSLAYLQRGYISLDLTEYSTTTAPQIAAGSIVEIDGVLYRNESAVSITGSVSNSTWYDVLLTPSWSTFTASYIASGTGAYSESKKGLYSGNNRVVAYVYIDGSGGYINKNVIIIKNRLISLKIKTGLWDMLNTSEISVIIPSSLSALGQIVSRDASIENDAGTGEYSIFHQENDDFGGGIVLDVSGTPVIKIRRNASAGGNSYFATTSFDDSTINRGHLFLTYEV